MEQLLRAGRCAHASRDLLTKTPGSNALPIDCLRTARWLLTRWAHNKEASNHGTMGAAGSLVSVELGTERQPCHYCCTGL